MEEKIQWYEEILHSDPSSTLFFPLAKLYLEKPDTLKAIEVLQRGIDKHPEHVEARLLLSDLLAETDRAEERDRLIGEVSSLLSRYPSFWRGWAEQLQRQGQEDLAASALFFGGNFAGSETSWSEVLKAGIQAVLVGQGQPPDAGTTEEAGPSSGESGSNESPAEEEDSLNASSEDQEEIIELVDDRDDEDVESSNGNAEEVEAPTTYRTKTMADILAGQGDYAGALEIYRELLDETSDSEKRNELEDRIRTVQEKQSAEGGSVDEPAERGPESDKKALLHRMEKLAERLEARG
jgi:tetratricopeptide (TPR) repeat protein